MHALVSLRKNKNQPTGRIESSAADKEIPLSTGLPSWKRDFFFVLSLSMGSEKCVFLMSIAEKNSTNLKSNLAFPFPVRRCIVEVAALR